MGNVTIIVVLSLIVFNTYTASIDRTTEFPKRELRIPTAWLLKRVARYLLMSDLYNLYKADHILADSFKDDIIRMIKYYEIENDIRLDTTMFDDDALQGPPNFRVNMCMERALMPIGYLRDNWETITGVPNSVCEVCYKTRQRFTPYVRNRALETYFVLQPGYYEPRIRVKITEDLLVRRNAYVRFAFYINEDLHSLPRIAVTTVNHLNELRLRRRYQWFYVRFPIVNVVAPGSRVDWGLHTQGVAGVMFDSGEMWLTNAAASQRPVDPSAVHIDPNGDALVSNSYRPPPTTTVTPSGLDPPPTTTVTPSGLDLKCPKQKRRIENADTIMPKAKIPKI